MGLSESTRSSSYFEYSLKLYLALWQWANAFGSIRYTVESGWFGFIDLRVPEVPWLLMGVWMWRRWFWNLRFDYWRCFKHLRCLWSPLITSCEYVRYSGIVRAMPTYNIRPLGIWSGSLLCDLCICDLLLTFGYCSKRTTLALWLLMTGYWLRSPADLLSMWDTSTLWGQCLRILFSLQILDLESCIMIFMPLTCCWLLVVTVSELC